MSAKYKSPSFLLPNELNTSANPANDTGINSLYSMDFGGAGSSQKIDVGILPMNGDAEFSISIWFYYFKPGGSVPAMQMFGNRDGSNSYKGVAFEFGNAAAGSTVPVSYFYFNSTAGSGAALVGIPAGTFNANAWNHLCITKDLTTVNAYVNNQSPISVSSTKVFSSTASFKIGTDINSYYNNKIDEVAIFNRALNTTEIAALYDGTGSNIRPSNLMATDLNPIAYYPLGEQAQNTGYLDPSNPGNDIAGSEWQFPNGVLQDYVIDFDGVDDSIQINPAINLGTTNTISLWYNGETNAYSTVLGNDDALNDYAVFIDNGTTVAYKVAYTGFNGVINWNVTNVNDGNWHHLVFFRTNTTINFYLDGNLQTVNSNNLQNNDTKIDTIGAKTDGSMPFKGKMSNLAIWNTDQLTNLANIYNNGSPQTTYTVTPQNWWKLNATSVYTPSAPNYTTALGFNSTKNDFDKVTVGDLTTLATPSNDITISLWAKLRTIANTPDKYGMIYSDKSGYIYFSLSGSVLKYESNLRGTTNLKDTTGIAPSELLKWHHIVVTFSGTEAKLYYNSQLLDTGTAGSATNFGEDTTIGTLRNTTNATYSFNGFISNVAVLQSALSASQVSTLFNFGTPETNISFSPIHNWKLDNLTTGLNDTGSLASNNGTAGSVNGTGPVQESTSVAAVPSWKIPSALPIATPNYTTALDFNGNGDYVTLNSSINLTGNKTVSYWVNPNSFGDVYIGGVQGIDYYTYMTSSLLYIKDSTGFDAFNITGHISTGSWYHICITGDGTNATLYINGDFISTINDKNPTIDAIGAYNNGGYSADAKMSNVQIFNSALPATGSNSVETLYNNGSPLTSMSGFTSLQGWWKLDSTTITDSAGSNNGTNSSPGAAQVTSDVLTPQPVNGVSTTLPSTALQQSDLQFDSPYSNYSLSFDGNSYIDTNFTLPASYTSFSYSFWFKRTTSANPGTEYIISNLVAPGNNTQARGLIRFGVTNLRIQGGDGTSPDYDTGNISATAILDQNWHHISVTFVSGEIKTYFDGSLVNTYTNSLVVTGYAADRTYVIGQNGIGTGYLVNSRLDEFAIFDKKLTEAEILSIYNSGRPGDISPIAPTNWWRLGENAYFVNNDITLPNSVSGAPNGVSSGTATSMLSADAPGTYANGIGTNLDIVDRVGDAALSTANSQSYNMIPSDISPYVPGYGGDQISNTYSMVFDGINDYITIPNISLSGEFTLSWWMKRSNYANINNYFFGEDNANNANWIRFSNGDLDIKIGASSGADYQLGDQGTKPNFTFVNNNWYNIVITRDSNFLIQAYANGLVDPNYTPLRLPKSGATPVSFAPNTFGRKNTTYLDGIIDEVVIFDKALTAGQIYNDIYQPTATGTNQTADIANNPNLPTPVAWYRMGD